MGAGLISGMISRCVEIALSKANPADAPSRREDSFSEPQVGGELASLQQASRVGQVLEGRGMSIDRLSIK